MDSARKSIDATTHGEEHMNYQEINKMMSHLPSQQPQESLTDKVLIGTIFTVFLIVMCMLPDIMR